ncbi:hypothetical protein [Bartonella sp. CL63NXGY]|uniref:hypothetical protein n=1 Tax=Bartonella sp. CL63NXGY TaxID=3243538 RepID=UPI0035CFBFFA
MEIKCVIEAIDFDAIEAHGLKDGGFDEANGGWGKKLRLIEKAYRGKKREAKEE